jgi:predicted nucleic acid-binding protein
VSAPRKPRRGQAAGGAAAALSATATATTPVVLDSSCWLDYFADTAQADLFAPAIEAVESLVVPVLTVYEVVKKLAREAGDETAAAALGLMQRGRVVAIDLNLALAAAVNGLPLADSLIYATARQHGAELWTQDRHFEGLPGVKFFAKA